MRSYLEEVDFETIKQRFDAFWKREVLDRPLIFITAPRKRRKKLFFTPENIKKRWVNTDYVTNKAESYLENTAFLGDAIPCYQPNLGPDSFTSFLGANLIFRSEETSWAKPFVKNLSEYNPVLNRNSRWWRAMNGIINKLCEISKGNFLIGIPDLHYGGDSLVAAMTAQRLIRSLFVEPAEVKRLICRLTDICIEIFESYYRSISRVQKGSITWIPAYSRGRYFALQDDFSGLVSPKMFKEFFLEEQDYITKCLDNSVFHLDGPMALGNLDILLQIESLNGIQWVPGAGAQPMSRWVDVCVKILDAGKCLYIDCMPNEVEFLLSKLSHKGLFLSTNCRTEKEAQSVIKIVERHH
jgi:5-methyltetrahydrofolate--homocysteine methyltransferase